MSKGLGRKIVVKFSEEITGGVESSKDAFKIFGQEPQYESGPLIDREYPLQSIELRSNKELELVLNDTDRIHNTVGEVEVSYDATIGNLMGRGGMVEAFDFKFTPTDLVPKRNPIVTEHITVGASAEVAFTEVTYNRGYEKEHITVSATASVEFIHVGVVNP